MTKYLLLATATAVVLGCTACTSNTNDHANESHSLGLSATTPAASPASVAVPSATSIVATSAGSPSASTFCALARKVGKSDLAVSAGNLDPDPKKLLSQVDRLEAIAPPALKHDFDVFAGFEHTVLDPGNPAPSSTVRGDTTVALEHVSSYLATVCEIK